MRDAPLQNLAEAMGWMAYLAVVGGGLFERELFGLGANDDGEASDDEPATVVQLDEYREARRIRSVDSEDESEEADEYNVA